MRDQHELDSLHKRPRAGKSDQHFHNRLDGSVMNPDERSQTRGRLGRELNVSGLYVFSCQQGVF